ncbi:MAG: type II toxin-antitoxin system RelE/ParE family toxin [Flavobacteriales bacterium]|nr:type II toxin-antitoxin system RelE/ParE family toxin [Flavobacteriales bacterium]
MASEFQIIWSDEAISNLEKILDYLERKWTEREVNRFKVLLSRQLDIIQNNPELFPKSGIQSLLRKAVLSKQTSIYYLIRDDSIYLVYLFDNRMNPEKLK